MSVIYEARSVPVAPLRDAFLASGLTAYEVATRLGWTRKRKNLSGDYGDHSRLMRRLGLQTYHCPRRGGTFTQERMHYDVALAIAEAIGVDPHEVGL